MLINTLFHINIIIIWNFYTIIFQSSLQYWIFFRHDVIKYRECCMLIEELLHASLGIAQWFLTFFAPWTPKSWNKFHGPLKCFYILLTDPLIPVKVVYMSTVLYFSDLHGPPRPTMDPRSRTYDMAVSWTFSVIKLTIDESRIIIGPKDWVDDFVIINYDI